MIKLVARSISIKRTLSDLFGDGEIKIHLVLVASLVTLCFTAVLVLNHSIRPSPLFSLSSCQAQSDDVLSLSLGNGLQDEQKLSELSLTFVFEPKVALLYKSVLILRSLFVKDELVVA